MRAQPAAEPDPVPGDGFDNKPDTAAKDNANAGAGPEVTNGPESTIRDKTGAEERRSVLDDETFWTSMLEQNGVKIDQAEMKVFLSSINKVLENAGPEFAEYVQILTGKMGTLVTDMAKLKAEGRDVDAVKLLLGFLSEQEAKINLIQDPELKATILGLMDSALNLQDAQKEISTHMKIELASEITNLIPIIGSLKMVVEASLGKTAAGATLEGKKRAIHAAEGVVFLALDVAAFFTAGTTEIAKSKKAAELGKTGAKGYYVGKGLTRFAAWLRKAGGMNKLAKSVFTIGQMIKKYPKTAGVLVKIIERHRRIKQAASVAHIGSVIKGQVKETVDGPATHDEPAPDGTSINEAEVDEILDEIEPPPASTTRPTHRPTKEEDKPWSNDPEDQLGSPPQAA